MRNFIISPSFIGIHVTCESPPSLLLPCYLGAKEHPKSQYKGKPTKAQQRIKKLVEKKMFHDE